MENPFSRNDKDRFELWNILVQKDIEAFVNQDWEKIKEDFIEEGFTGINANKISSPDGWTLSYPNLESYKKDWLKQAKYFGETSWKENLLEAIHKITILNDIDINGNRALVHKKILGSLEKSNGEKTPTNWETLYRCSKVNNTWKIAGFTGYLPLTITQDTNLKVIPPSSVQHKTAGPYSPVLEVDPQKLVIISGQAAIDLEGNIIGDTIEEQTKVTFENCAKKLSYAGCTLDNVFKVNVYMKDLKDWPRFNDVYKNYFTDPLPVRTAVETGLLMTLLVEVEMWAVKPA